jgi:phage terminase large subunit
MQSTLPAPAQREAEPCPHEALSRSRSTGETTCDGCGIAIGSAIKLIEPAQRNFVESEALYPGLFAGRGYSKTASGAFKLFRYAQKYPGAYGICTQPTIDAIERNLLPVIREHFGHLEGTVWIYKEKKQQLVFPTQRVTVFLRPGSEPDACRGLTVAFGWMDEIGVEDQMQTFLQLQPALRQQGYPNQLWVTSTPMVRRRWIQQIWVDHVFPPDPRNSLPAGDYPAFYGETQDNPHLPEHIRKGLYASWQGTRLAAQELQGQFISVEGVAFPDLKPEVHFQEAPNGTEFIKTVVGLDFGGSAETAMLEIKMDRSRKLWVTREFYKRNATNYDWISEAKEWGAKLIICDPSASEKDLVHWRRTYGINIKRALDKRHDRRYALWLSHLAVKNEDKLPGIRISPTCTNLWEELTNLAHNQDRMGNPKEDWAPGTADHLYDAGAYALSYYEKGALGPAQPFATIVRAA